MRQLCRQVIGAVGLMFLCMVSLAQQKTERDTLCPPFAVKTNLLFDAVGAWNVEVEIPLGQRFSANVEWTAPWWLKKDNTFCYEANSMTLEGRYWWTHSADENPMLTGWFSSVYANTAKYDLQNSEKGMQGVLWNVGAGGGYAWNIGTNWGMEAMLGIGYMHTRYEQYVPKENYTILSYQRTLQTQWIGPTRLKLSVYYKFGQYKYNKKYKDD